MYMNDDELAINMFYIKLSSLSVNRPLSVSRQFGFEARLDGHNLLTRAC